MSKGVLCLLLGLLSFAVTAQDSARKADIRELMLMTGSDKIALQFADAVSQSIGASLRKSRPDVPERAFVVIHNEMTGLFQEKMMVPGGLFDRIIPVYEKHFTQEEIRGLIAFYRTPLGKKAISVLPAVTNESMLAGRAWGESLGPEIGRRVQAALQREGIEIPKK